MYLFSTVIIVFCFFFFFHKPNKTSMVKLKEELILCNLNITSVREVLFSLSFNRRGQ